MEIVRSSGKPIRQVANELVIYDSTLGNWVRQDEINCGERKGSRLMSGSGSVSWSGRTFGCGRGRELVETSCGLVGAGVEGVMLYRFVDAQRADGFPVGMVCSVVRVPPSAYYAYKKRPESGSAQMAEAALVGEIRAIWHQSGETYGSPRATPTRAGREPQAGGTVDEVPPYGGFRTPQAACHHSRGHCSSDP